MDNKELIKKKNCGECICDGCERRFVCWTTKRVFSEPTHQALYEAYIAEGCSHDDAVKEVEGMLQQAIMEAAKYEAAKNTPDFKKWEGPWDDKISKWERPWERKKWSSWQTLPKVSDITRLPVEEAMEEVKNMRQYFRSMISGKSTKRQV